MPATIRRIESAEAPVIAGLCTLLMDAVQDGASVGFLASMSRQSAVRYWEQAIAALPDGMALWVAESGGEVVGTVQLSCCAKENGRHRAEVQKLLVLDTIAGSPAEFVYRHLGWQKVGEIPDYAAMPDGELRPTAYYYKRCPD